MSASPFRRLRFRAKTKNAYRPPPDLKKVVGDYESRTVTDGEDAVNRKFASDSESRERAFSFDFRQAKKIRRGLPAGRGGDGAGEIKRSRCELAF
jgi:hypothetical protein